MPFPEGSCVAPSTQNPHDTVRLVPGESNALFWLWGHGTHVVDRVPIHINGKIKRRAPGYF